MANFNEALHLTAINEGGYSNSKDDHGGETYAGIARKFWPNWQGWSHIDLIKKDYGTSNINMHAKKDVVLQSLVQQFYKQNFWDVNKLDQVNNQQLADSIYDFGVNSGVERAADFLQQAAGVKQDGNIGAKTLEAVNSANPETLYNAYNELRKLFYNRIAIGNQHQFLDSWLSRLKPYVAMLLIALSLCACHARGKIANRDTVRDTLSFDTLHSKIPG
jgi:lysozyme family protein